jgi:hypothetical protein
MVIFVDLGQNSWGFSGFQNINSPNISELKPYFRSPKKSRPDSAAAWANDVNGRNFDIDIYF